MKAAGEEDSQVYIRDDSTTYLFELPVVEETIPEAMQEVG